MEDKNGGPMKDVSGYTNLIVNGDLIKITVDEVLVTGKIIQRDRRSIAVELVSPFGGISQSSGYIPLLASQFYNFAGSRGDDKAAGMLCALYRFCLYAQDHKDRLLAALADYKFKYLYAKHFSASAVAREQRKTEILQKLQHLRKELKAGIIDNLAYQRGLTPLRKELDQLDYESQIDTSTIFDECFSRFSEPALWELWQETVIAYLEKMKTGGMPDKEE